MPLEFDEKLSRLEAPDRDDMTDKEYDVFNQNVEMMEQNWGFINNLFKVLPLNASQYMGFLNFKGSLFNPDTCYLSNADKEMMGLVVSSINCCSYCLTTHGDALRGYTKDPVWVDRLIYNYRSCEMTVKQRALCDYAWYVTKHPDEIGPEQIQGLRDAGFNDHEVLEAAYIAGFFNYTNRWVSTIAPIANPGHYNHNRGL